MTKRIFLSPPCMLGRERELLLEAFDSNWIAPLGPQVDLFEQEFAARVGVPHAAALATGTAALHLALRILGVGPGDEVITSSFTFAATANAITYVNARPVFLDSDAASWNLDPNLLADELAERARSGRLPRAVLGVDILGQCCQWEAIVEICRRYEVPVIEDAAEALGASYQGRPAGAWGDIACFSFNGNKIITTSSGGMLVTARPEWAEKARFLATQARDPAPHYQHSEIGHNYRMSNLLAAVGRGQLETLDEHVRRRRALFARYVEQLAEVPGLTWMPEIPGGFSTRWLIAVLIDPDVAGFTREDLRLKLAAENIESRPAWKPMHQQPVFAAAPRRLNGVSDKIFEQGLCLPSGTALSIEEQDRVIGAFGGA